jgi:CheY-like chemotaxis protein
MPVMDGPTTLQEIRKRWGAIPVVLHTGHVEGPLLNRALEWSPFTVLSKPCPMDRLVETMRGLDRQRQGRPNDPATDIALCQT